MTHENFSIFIFLDVIDNQSVTLFEPFSELTKINTFYSEKLAEATRKFATLKSELSAAAETHTRQDGRNGFGRNKKEVVYREKVINSSWSKSSGICSSSSSSSSRKEQL